MSEFTQDDFDIIMREEPKADDDAYRGFDMKLHEEDVPGTGRGKGSDDLDLGDLMKMKAEEQPKLPPGETPQMLNTMGELDKLEQFLDEYAKSHPKKLVSMGQVNPLFHKSKVKFDEDKNKTYLYDPLKSLSMTKSAIRERERRARNKKKEGFPFQEGGRKRKKKTRRRKINCGSITVKFKYKRRN